MNVCFIARRIAVALSVVSLWVTTASAAAEASATDAGLIRVPANMLAFADAKPKPRTSHWIEARKIPVGTKVSLADEASINADAASATSEASSGGRWKSLFHAGRIPFEPDVSLQLTNGDVMLHEYGTPYWWGLHPNRWGDYSQGMLTKLAEMPKGYAPVYECSTVLADGRVIVYGGEYLAVIDEQSQTTQFPEVNANQGAIYDPVANTWATLPAIAQPVNSGNGITLATTPFGGDNSCVVMPNGKLILASVGNWFNFQRHEYDPSSFLAILDPATLTWEVKSPPGLTAGNDENNWTLLPDGTIFTVDARQGLGHRYLPPWIDGTADGEWIDAGTPPVTLPTAIEMGPGVLRPDGSVLVIGATANVAIYHPPLTLRGAGSWSVAEGLTNASGQAIGACDGAASLLPSGDVLVGAAVGCYTTKSLTFLSVDGASATPLENQPDFAPTSVTCAINNMLLPTGQILVQGQTDVVDPTYTGLAAGEDYPVASLFTPHRREREEPPQWAPAIESMPNEVKPGTTFTLTGRRLNGVSQGSYYGDDGNSYTNYPLVRATSLSTGEVEYWRTHEHSSMEVANGAEPNQAKLTHTRVDVPHEARDGWYQLVVVANGVASRPATLRVEARHGW